MSRGELLRKVVHIGCGGFAFLLRDLLPAQAAAMAVAAFVFNWQVLPRIGGRALWRGADHAHGYPRGILLYPLVGAGPHPLLLERASGWRPRSGVSLAFGDGWPRSWARPWADRACPGTASKGWVGLAAFVVFGTLGAAGAHRLDAAPAPGSLRLARAAHPRGGLRD